jgi:hypothetical protein
MKRSMQSWLLMVAVVASCAGPYLLSARPAAATNLNFNFNNGTEGWTVDPASSNPSWVYNGGPSSSGGGWQGFVSSLEPGGVAYLLSPCLEIDQNNNQLFVHADLSHSYDFPVSMQGQVQYRYSLGGVWQEGWHVIKNQSAEAVKDGWLTDNEHDAPDAPAQSPLIVLDGALAFSGKSDHLATGGNGNSAFDLLWADVAAGFGNGDEIMFRFALGTLTESSAGELSAKIWEINSMEFDGVRLCQPVPEIDPATGGSALSLVAGVLAMIERRGRRAFARAAA